MSDFLPEEVMVEILSRLHIKSLLRCTAVCKSWYFLIKSPAFIRTHSEKRSTHNVHNLLLVGLDHGRRYALHLDDHQLQEYVQMDFPFRAITGGSLHAVSGYCNGLVYVSDLRFPHKSMILWNPLIRKFKALPEPISPTSFPMRVMCGLGFDSANHDYKMLKIMELKKENQQFIEAEVFSHNSGSWKSITSPNIERICSHMVFVNGILNCIACRRVEDGNGFYSFVLGFDIAAERFCEIMLPTESLRSINCIKSDGKSLSIFVYRGLSIAVGQFDMASQCSRELWVLREYAVEASWTKLLTVGEELPDGKVLTFRNHGEIMLEKFEDRSFLSFDPERRLMTDIVNLGPDNGVCSVVCYQESLALLDAEDSTNDEEMFSDFEDYFL